MYAVYDLIKDRIDQDEHGHVKIYSGEKAARRRAQSLNNSVAPKMEMYGIIKVAMRPEMIQGSPNVLDARNA